mgnify:CR=1 FL=1
MVALMPAQPLLSVTARVYLPVAVTAMVLPVAPVDQPLVALVVAQQLDRPLVAGVGQDGQQLGADAALVAAAEPAARGGRRA